MMHNCFLFQGELEAAQEPQGKEEAEEEEAKDRIPRKTHIMRILATVGRKLITNPNTHATVLGIIWASISFR